MEYSMLKTLDGDRKKIEQRKAVNISFVRTMIVGRLFQKNEILTE